MAGWRANPGQLDSNDDALRFGDDRRARSFDSGNLCFDITVVMVMMGRAVAGAANRCQALCDRNSCACFICSNSFGSLKAILQVRKLRYRAINSLCPKFTQLAEWNWSSSVGSLTPEHRHRIPLKKAEGSQSQLLIQPGLHSHASPCGWPCLSALAGRLPSLSETSLCLLPEVTPAAGLPCFCQCCCPNHP